MSYGLYIDYPDGWLQLPGHDHDDLAGWAGEAARRILTARTTGPSPMDGPALVEHLLGLAQESAARRPTAAAALFPVLGAPAMVVLEIFPLLSEDGEQLTTAAIATAQQAAHRDLLRPADVTALDELSLGPAVRVRRFWKGPPDRWRRRRTSEELSYFLLPRALAGEGLLLRATWTDLDLGPAFTGEVEAVLAGIKVLPED